MSTSLLFRVQQCLVVLKFSMQSHYFEFVSNPASLNMAYVKSKY